MDIGKAVPAWLGQWAAELAKAWEVMGEVGWEIEYEYAGSAPNVRRDDGPEDLWHLTMFPMPVVSDDERQLVPQARVDVLAIQEMLDDVDDVSLLSDGVVRVSGTKNKTMVEVDLYRLPPVDDEDEDEK